MIEGEGCDSDKVYLMKYPSRREGEHFPGSIVNGVFWYEIDGGMQYWNYWNRSCFEVTIELGCVKYPESKLLDKYWESNKNLLLLLLKLLKYCYVVQYVTMFQRLGFMDVELQIQAIFIDRQFQANRI